MPGDQHRRFCCRGNRDDQLANGLQPANLAQIATVFSLLRSPDVRASEPRGAVDRDGMTSAGSRDPPGQSSVYIPPGDHWIESYRLVTFSAWPTDTPVSRNELAASGFYYTGFKDRVKCFSCGISVENWTIEDEVTDPRWHRSDCAMAAETDHTNVPLLTTKLKRAFRRTLRSSDARTPTLAAPCGMQQRDTDQQNNGMNQDRRWPDAAMLNATARSSTSQRPYPPLTLGDVHSPDHERLLYSLDLSKEADRRKTFIKWPSYPAPLLPNRLAEEGFFYLGNLDRAQCFSCSGVLRNWARDDNPRTEHARHFPNCRIILGLETRNVPLTWSERRSLEDEERQCRAALRDVMPKEPADPPMEERIFLSNRFPCHDPINPYMENLASRIATFNSSWPAHSIRATPEQIAKAGFFFLGQGDRTKCFFCNGGLQNWDEYDEPWTEHAKWFPGCAFVIRNKGPRFVRELVEANPNLSRPPIRNPVSYDVQYTPPPPRTASSVTMVAHGPAVGACAKPPGIENMSATLKNLISEKLCKQCFQEDADRLAQPCGHVSLCSNCVSSSLKCPLCKVKIESTIKIYRT